MSDHHESSKELEHELDRQRSEIAHTADELKDRLSPDTLIDRGVDYLRGSGGQRLMRAARENPLALLITGAGLAWLLQTASRPPRRVEVEERKVVVPARTPAVPARQADLATPRHPETNRTGSAAPPSAAASAGLASGTTGASSSMASSTTGSSAPSTASSTSGSATSNSTSNSAATGASRPGMMGDGTEEQNLGQPGNPSARITEDEVKEAFGGDTNSSTTSGAGSTPKPGSSAGWPNPT